MGNMTSALLVVTNAHIAGGTNGALGWVWPTLAAKLGVDWIGYSMDSVGPSSPHYPGVRFLPGTEVANRPQKLLAAIAQIWRIVREQQPDLVLSVLPRANICTSIALRQSTKRPALIVAERNHVVAHYAEFGIRGQATLQALKQTYALADVIAVNSVAVGASLQRSLGADPARLVHTRNAVPPTVTPLDRDDRARVALFVGRLNWQKAPEVCVDALQRWSRTVPLPLTVLGDGPRRALVERRVACHGLESLVEMTGQLEADRVEEMMRRAMVLIAPSRYEGSPNVVLEAMARSLPVVGVDGPGGMAELLAPGRGILVPREDSTAIAQGVLDIVAGEESADSSAARDFVLSHHSLENSVADWLAAFDRVTC